MRERDKKRRERERQRERERARASEWRVREAVREQAFRGISAIFMVPVTSGDEYIQAPPVFAREKENRERERERER